MTLSEAKAKRYDIMPDLVAHPGVQALLEDFSWALDRLTECVEFAHVLGDQPFNWGATARVTIQMPAAVTQRASQALDRLGEDRP